MTLSPLSRERALPSRAPHSVPLHIFQDSGRQWPGRQSTKTGKRVASLCSESAVGCSRSQETTQIVYIWSPPPTVTKGKEIQSTLGKKAGSDGMNIGTMSRVRQVECFVSNRSDRKKGTHSLQSYVEPRNPDLPVNP